MARAFPQSRLVRYGAVVRIPSVSSFMDLIAIKAEYRHADLTGQLRKMPLEGKVAMERILRG
jgi:hypothetical protein